MVGHINDTEKKVIDHPDVKGASIQVLIGEQEGWDSHVMRVLTLEAFGHSPKHEHPWPHINYIIEGEGELEIEGVVTPLSGGSYAYVPDNANHQFRNTTDKPFKFMCIVPTHGHA